MPNKTIYISDADLPIFEKAQQLAGDNLSATIVQALRRFIETQETKETEYREITLKVGKVVHTFKRFTGRRIAKGFYGASEDQGARKIEVYQTMKGRIAVYIEYLPQEWFAGWSGKIKFGAHGPGRAFVRGFGREFGRDFGGDWSHLWEAISKRTDMSGWQLERVLEVYENLDEAKKHIPSDLYEAAKQGISGDSVEVLDI